MHSDEEDAPVDLVVAPSGQLMQLKAPVPLTYVPTGQGKQRDDPGNSANFPGVQRTQTAEDVAPMALEAEPDGHNKQAVCAS